MKLNHFKDIPFLPAIKALFNELKVPMNYVADEPTTAEEILKDTYKDNETFQLVNDVYFVGMIDDAAFEGNQSLDTHQIKSDYDGILVFGITLDPRDKNLLPTRSQLAEISRAFNREFYYTPVVLVFKYQNDEAHYIAFANTERLKYKQAWREGEKAGKVSLLRDINIEKPHRGHEDIINQLRIPTSGTKAVDSFSKLYSYWQEVFSVSVLNKKFYQELSNWYFWAVKHVTFPNKPTAEIAHEKGAKLEDLILEHNATNVIRLLTRLLFTWFIKEKKLIPEALFDLDALQKDILNEISPFHEEGTMFAQANKDSIYYKAILQNLFFASLNCPIEADKVDNRTRGFRGDETYGKHRGIDWMMRYKKYFKDPDTFLKMMNKTVPFLNGGLFECLDDKTQNLYIDGFSDQMTKGEQLIVPDYLFFGTAEEVDLSAEYGVKNKGTKQAAVKGLINILKSYKFTITENTPIEEDVALDPELLGKVFENLLANYNPETKTTARKQTGSFYTPREIVNYMVDESLIAYLKNAVSDWDMEQKELDEKLHQLTSFDPVNPFDQNDDLSKRIVKALDECTILDPACGSGAFPMGILQKMVHMLQKLDPQNEYWKEVQLNKAISATEEAYGIEDKKEREEKLIEINNAFDENINDPDYARKLYLIENCIYGVDIQPIATQIAKLRFFISLVVDQKATDVSKDNFNVRPLPNLETKFVTANTLIGIEKEDSLFYTDEIKEKEAELKKVRHKLFSARTKETKLKYRQMDKELREEIAAILENGGMPLDESKKLASWDPYDQNASSSFFDPEWMFDISEGFNVVIGNPPYVFTRDVDFDGNFKKYIEDEYFSKMTRGKKSKSNQSGKINLFAIFIIKGLFISAENGHLYYILPNNILRTTTYDIIRRYILENAHIDQIVDLGSGVFENVTASTVVFGLSNEKSNQKTKVITEIEDIEKGEFTIKSFVQNQFLQNVSYSFNIFMDERAQIISSLIDNMSNVLGSLCIEIIPGIDAPKNLIFSENNGEYYELVEGKCIGRFEIKPVRKFLKWDINKINRTRPDHVWEAPKKIITQRISGGKKPLVVALDLNKKRTFNSVNNIILKEEFDHLYESLEIILNSDVVNWYYANNFSNNSTLTVNISKTFLEMLPISTMVIDSSLSFVLNPISEILRFSLNDSVISKVANSIVFNLYFFDHMREQGIDVLEYVELDINQAMQGRNFDNLSDLEKENVIEQLKASWSNPDNEVRNRMKLFAVRSPEILKPILES
jgi:type I restriction-modification system DNA methylase subunit